MLKGAFKHEDSAGHKGVIEAGDLQWMTAGRGIIHSEVSGGGVGLWLLPFDRFCLYFQILFDSHSFSCDSVGFLRS